jgi:hypothetical protein
MEMLTNEQLRITGSVVDGPAWLDVNKAAAEIPCARPCIHQQRSAASGDGDMKRWKWRLADGSG